MSKKEQNLSKELKRLQDTSGSLPKTVPAKTRGQLAADQAEAAAFQPPHSSTSRDPISAGSDAEYQRPVFQLDPEVFVEASPEGEATDQQQDAAEVASNPGDSTSSIASDASDEEEEAGGAAGGGGGNGGAGSGGNEDNDNNGGQSAEETEEDDMADTEIKLDEVHQDGKAWTGKVNALDADSKTKVESLLLRRKANIDDSTEAIKKVKDLNNKDPLTEVDAQILKDRVETLEGIKIKILNVDSSIGNLIQSSGAAVFGTFSFFAEARISIVLRVSYQLLKANKVEINEDLNTTWPDASYQDDGNIVASKTRATGEKRQTTVIADPSKMPRNEHLEDIKFNGKKPDYSRFKMQAKNLFGDTPYYTYVTKFKCLEKCLPENLKKLASSQMPSEEGYMRFWQEMDRSFGQPRDTINYWQNQFKTLPSIQMMPTTGAISVGKLESYISAARLIIRKLEEAGAMGQEQHYHMQWMPDLTAHLPPLITREWWGKYEAMKNDKKRNPIQEWFDYLQTWLDNSRHAAQAYQQLQDKLPPKPPKGFGNKPAKQEQSFATSSGPKPQQVQKEYQSIPAKYCYLCIPSGTSTDPPPSAYKHEPKHCKNAPKEEAYSKCYKARACIACGNLGHILTQCRNKKKCEVSNCEWDHMKSLHDCKYLSYQNFRKKKSGRGRSNKNKQ